MMAGRLGNLISAQLEATGVKLILQFEGWALKRTDNTYKAERTSVMLNSGQNNAFTQYRLNTREMLREMVFVQKFEWKIHQEIATLPIHAIMAIE